MEKEENQYLIKCEEDNSFCVVYEEDIVYNGKVKLECGSTVWFMYKIQGSEEPYRGKIIEISCIMI